SPTVSRIEDSGICVPANGYIRLVEALLPGADLALADELGEGGACDAVGGECGLGGALGAAGQDAQGFERIRPLLARSDRAGRGLLAEGAHAASSSGRPCCRYRASSSSAGRGTGTWPMAIFCTPDSDMPSTSAVRLPCGVRPSFFRAFRYALVSIVVSFP